MKPQCLVSENGTSTGLDFYQLPTRFRLKIKKINNFNFFRIKKKKETKIYKYILII